MMELIFIRHLQTPGNQKRQYIGRTDEPLEEQGINQSIIQKRQKDCQGAEVLIASPMKRCVQTGTLLLPNVSPLLCEKLKECDFGLFEGKSFEELQHREDYQGWLESGGTLPFPEGESHEAFKSRCVEGFFEIMESLLGWRTKKAVLVVHGGTIMAILSAIDGDHREFYDWQPENGCGYRVILDPELWKDGQRMSREIEKL